MLSENLSFALTCVALSALAWPIFRFFSMTRHTLFAHELEIGIGGKVLRRLRLEDVIETDPEELRRLHRDLHEQIERAVKAGAIGIDETTVVK